MSKESYFYVSINGEEIHGPRKWFMVVKWSTIILGGLALFYAVLTSPIWIAAWVL